MPGCGADPRPCPRREGTVVLSYDALFAAEQLPGPGLQQLLGAALGSARSPPGLAVGTAPVLRHAALGECEGPGARWAHGGHRLGRER